MVKSVLTSAYDFGSPVASIVGVTSKGLDGEHLRKAAGSSSSIFRDVKISPEKGKTVLHIIAMSSAPFYPANKNGDAFFDADRKVELAQPAGDDVTIQLGKGLKDTYKTFETDAKVFKEHFNGKDDKIYGDVLKAGYNPDMHRVELLLSLPVDEWRDELTDLDNGKDLGFSMSCSLPEDMCSLCGNRAASRRGYCDHLKHDLGQMTSDGHLISAINDDVTFFDISGVKNPADRIAFHLMKAASSSVMGGAQLAEMLKIPCDGIEMVGKAASVIKKLAELEKQIECTAPADDPINIAAVTPDLPDDAVETLKSAGLSSEQVLGCLADAKVVLSLKDFLKVIMGPQFDSVSSLADGAEERLPGVFSRMCVDPKVHDGAIQLPDTPTPMSLRSLIGDLQDTNGMDDDHFRKRVTIIAVKGGGGTAVKSASVKPENSTEEVIAQLYGQYKAAFCRKHLADNGLTFCSVLGHYITHK